MITEDDIEESKSINGSWSAKTLAQWGVPWPPPKGWKEQLIATGQPYDRDWKPPVKTFQKMLSQYEQLEMIHDGANLYPSDKKYIKSVMDNMKKYKKNFMSSEQKNIFIEIKRRNGIYV